jgi:hypothetical protein
MIRKSSTGSTLATRITRKAAVCTTLKLITALLGTLRDVEAVAYGATSTTFTQYRKSIIRTMQLKNIKLAPPMELEEDLDDSPSGKLLEKTRRILMKLRKKYKGFLGPETIKEEPFYAWQCVSLHFG